jgi:hypothetical protein
VPDPVAIGIVTRLDRPGGNTSGFAIWEASLERNVPQAPGSAISLCS